MSALRIPPLTVTPPRPEAVQLNRRSFVLPATLLADKPRRTVWQRMVGTLKGLL